MTNRLWNYLEEQFGFIREANEDEYLDFTTDMGTFIVEPIYDCAEENIINFVVYHGSYMTNAKEEPDIWFWEEIEKHIFNN